jgi:hypothetical protein
MRIYSVVSNSFSCLERNPEQKPCYFIFQKGLFGGVIERELLQLYKDSENNPELRQQYYRVVGERLRNFDIENNQVLKNDTYNVYFQLNEGSIDIKFADDTNRTVKDLYTSSEWTNYKDVWDYDRKCEIGIHDKSHFMWLSFIDFDLSQVNVKVKRLKSDGINQATSTETFTKENVLFLCGETFEIDGKKYYERSLNDGALSTLQQFDNVKNLTISTDTCVSLILIERK